MKTAMWLYLFMFVAFFDLHAQYPILSPFAISLGATPSFIGLIMGMYAITHLPGNWIAGFSVDRFGGRLFIIGSLIGAGILLLLQARVDNPWQLLAVRSVSGFVLAFLSPACLSMLARMARDRVHQGKLMAGNGLVHTIASVISPAAGAFLVVQLGFTASFTALGVALIAIGLLAIVGVKQQAPSSNQQLQLDPISPAIANQQNQSKEPIPWLFFGLPLAISCSQGILFFELPFMQMNGTSPMNTGLLFSLVSIGALCTLSMLFLNKYSPLSRAVWGALALAITFFGIAADWPLPLSVALLMIGMAKGVIFPAIASLLIALSGGSRYGRMFSLLSIAYSIGAFIGPIAAGQARSLLSPYFIAFVVLMLALVCLPIYRVRLIVHTNELRT